MAIHAVLARRARRVVVEVIDARVDIALHHADAVIADAVEVHEAGTAASVQRLAQARVLVLGLVDGPGTYKHVLDLANGQRQVLLVALDHAVHFAKQVLALGVGRPLRIAARAASRVVTVIDVAAVVMACYGWT